MMTASAVYIHEISIARNKAANNIRIVCSASVRYRQDNATMSPPPPSTGGAVYARRKKEAAAWLVRVARTPQHRTNHGPNIKEATVKRVSEIVLFAIVLDAFETRRKRSCY
jgi:hypothetical protein